MKHLSLLLVALCCFAIAGRAITVSGTVYLASSGPAAGAKVYLYDSSYVSPYTAGFIDSTTTSVTGAYSFTFTASANHYYAAMCRICGTPAYNYVPTTGSSATVNLYLSCSSFMVRDTVRNSTTGAPVSGQRSISPMRVPPTGTAHIPIPWARPYFICLSRYPLAPLLSPPMPAACNPRLLRIPDLQW